MIKHALIWSYCLMSLVEASTSGNSLSPFPPLDSLGQNSFIAEANDLPSSLTQTEPASYNSDIFELKRQKAGFTASGEFIYWKTTGSNWPYASLAGGQSPFTGILEKVSVQEVDFNYDPGFRIGVGYEFDYGWHLNADWTHFFSDAKAQNTPNSSFEFVQTVWTFFPAPVSLVKAHQFVHYDRLDFLISKEIFLGKRLGLNSYFGPLYAHLHQRLNLVTKQNFDDDTGGITVANLINNFDGGGVEIGMKGSYGPLDWFSIYGDGSVALAYGKFKTSNTTRITVNPTELQLPLFESASQNGLVSGFNIEAGFEGKWSFANDNFQLITHIGYELEIWPNQLRIYRMLPISTETTLMLLGSGNLGFQGLNIGLELRF